MFYFNNHVDDTNDNTLGTICALLTYNRLLKALTGLMVIAYIIHDRKSHLKSLATCVHGLWLSSTTTRNRHMTPARDDLQGLAIGHHVLPMFDDPLSQRGGLLVRFQRQRITVQHFTHVSDRSRPLTNVVPVDRAGPCCSLAGWSCEGSWVNDHRPPSRKRNVSIEGRRGLNNPHYSRPRVPSLSLMLVNVVQHGSVLVNLQQVLKFTIHEHGYIGTGRGSKFQAEL